MKTTISMLLLLIATNQTIGQTELQLNTEMSSIQWRGSMLFNFGEHYGTVNFKSGNLVVVNNKITTGLFTVDMNSIVNTDGDYSKNLVDHLKNEDFFNVEQFSTATLLITGIEYLKDERIRAAANLTLKNITKPIYFIAHLKDGHYKLETKFKIDRSDWNIEYGRQGNVEIKDYAISDAIEFHVNLVFNKNI